MALDDEHSAVPLQPKRLRREKTESVRLDNFVTNLDEALRVRTHGLRESTIRILIGTLIFIVANCLILMTLDAVGVIPPLRTAWVTVIGTTLGAGIFGTTLSLVMGWLFPKSRCTRGTSPSKGRSSERKQG